MKSELRRYSMEIEDVPYAQVPQPYIKEYEDKSGEWVYADVAIPTIKELEERNEKMLDAFRSLLLDMDNVDRVCDLAGVHPFTGMRSVIQSFVNEGEQE